MVGIGGGGVIVIVPFPVIGHPFASIEVNEIESIMNS